MKKASAHEKGTTPNFTFNVQSQAEKGGMDIRITQQHKLIYTKRGANAHSGISYLRAYDQPIFFNSFLGYGY